MKLILPDLKYKDEYLKALAEAKYEKTRSGLAQPVANQTFSDFINTLRNQPYKDKIAKNLVPATTYWLIDNDEFIGRVQIRHELNEELAKTGGHIGYYIRISKRKKGYGKKILELGLKEAKKLGIKKALVTCDVTNFASKKIIEANGGVFENTYDEKNGTPQKLRYWIKT